MEIHRKFASQDRSFSWKNSFAAPIFSVKSIKICGWGAKPDDQGCNSADAPGSATTGISSAIAPLPDHDQDLKWKAGLHQKLVQWTDQI